MPVRTWPRDPSSATLRARCETVMGITDDERRQRIEAIAFDYGAQSVSPVSSCNLCGDERFVVLTHRDRYRFSVQAHACQGCGLVFLNPVMTADAYREFYAHVYRPLVSAYHGRLIDATTVQAEQHDYVEERAALLEPYVEGRDYRTLLDIGGSTGVVAHALATRFGLRGTLLDPAPAEIEKARRRGLDTFTGLIEDFDPGGEQFDIVVMCQTVDHLLDISRALKSIHGLMRTDGVFFVDIVDFRAACLRHWSVEESVKVDHPYYLTETTMEAYLTRAGFGIVRTDYAADHLHVGYICRPRQPVSGALPSAGAVQQLFDEVRMVQNAPRPV